MLTEVDSSNNELLKARLAQECLSESERCFIQHYVTHIVAIEQVRTLTLVLI